MMGTITQPLIQGQLANGADPNWLVVVLGPYPHEVDWDDTGELWWDPIEGRWVR